MNDHKKKDAPAAHTADTEKSLQFELLVAHQLKSPVGAAATIVKTLLGKYAGDLTPQQKDLLSRADKRIDEALGTVGRMLAIVRPGQSAGDLGRAAEAAGIIRRIQLRYSEEARSRSIALAAEIHVEPAHVHIGEPLLTEILNALVNNAIKYTPDNGRIKLVLEPLEPENSVRIVVADSGIGVPEDQREKIFEPFYRAETAENTSVPGVGLGLSLVKTLVDTAEGRIWVEKSDTGGSAFSMVLPVAGEEDMVESAPGGDDDRMKVVIIGGVAAGPKVASKIIRLKPDTDVTIIDRESFLAYAGCGLPYYISGVVQEQKELMSTPLGCVRDPIFFQNVKNVNVLNRTEALQIDRRNKRVQIKNLFTGDTRWIDYDKLVLATGAAPIIPDLPGTHLKNVFTLHGVADAEGIKAHVTAGKAQDVVIIGGGLIGVETTEALVECGCRVTMIEQYDQILRMLDWEIARLVDHHMESRGVRVMCPTRALEITGTTHVEGVVTDKGSLPADLVILATGVRPEVTLAREAGVAIGASGGIHVDDRMCTSDPDIFAAGDCVECIDMITGGQTYMPLGSTANKQGRVAAINICDGDERFPGILRTSVCKVFDYCVARTGHTETEARGAGFDALAVLTGSPDREHFMPDAQMLLLKLVVDRASRRLLGVQAIGPGEAAKRVDIAATAIAAGMTVDQIANLDLCYAPPYSLAMDNLITGANIAKNKLAGAFKSIGPIEVHEMMQRGDNVVLLDVSSPQEYETERLPGSMLIPSGALRGRLTELPRDRAIITFCRLSIRGYEAALMLQAAGFKNVMVMDGGVVMWPFDKIYGMK